MNFKVDETLPRTCNACRTLDLQRFETQGLHAEALGTPAQGFWPKALDRSRRSGAARLVVKIGAIEATTNQSEQAARCRDQLRPNAEGAGKRRGRNAQDGLAAGPPRPPLEGLPRAVPAARRGGRRRPGGSRPQNRDGPRRDARGLGAHLLRALPLVERLWHPSARGAGFSTARVLPPRDKDRAQGSNASG